MASDRIVDKVVLATIQKASQRFVLEAATETQTFRTNQGACQCRQSQDNRYCSRAVIRCCLQIRRKRLCGERSAKMPDTHIALNLDEGSLNMEPITILTWFALIRMANTLRPSILYQRNETQRVDYCRQA